MDAKYTPFDEWRAHQRQADEKRKLAIEYVRAALERSEAETATLREQLAELDPPAGP